VRQGENRHHKLAAIVARHRCSIADLRTAQAVSAPDDSTPRYAAATSPPHSDRSASASCKLLVAESIRELTDLLNLERETNRFAHGRVWDLDAAWKATGNFEIADYQLSDSRP
jgi:hypothetical protein